MQLLSRAKPPSGGSDCDHLWLDRSLARSGATSFYAPILAKRSYFFDLTILLLDVSSGLLTAIILPGKISSIFLADDIKNKQTKVS